MELGRSGGINLINGNVLAHNLFHSENKIIIIIINQWQVRSSNIHFYIKYIYDLICVLLMNPSTQIIAGSNGIANVCNKNTNNNPKEEIHRRY